MLKKLQWLAPLALASQLLAGGFYLQVGTPEASPEAKKTGAILTVKAAGCHDPAAAKVTATGIGVVNGERREVPLNVIPLSSPGMFAVAGKLPTEGKWVVQLVGHNEEMFTNTLIGVGPDGVDRARFKENMKQFTAADIEAMLR